MQHYVLGHTIAQVVSHWIPTTAARVQAWVWSCGICGGENGAGVGFLWALQFPLPIFIPPITPQSPSPIIWGCYNRPVVATVPSGLSLTPLWRRTLCFIATGCYNMILLLNPGDSGSKILQNTGNNLPNYKASHLRRQWHSGSVEFIAPDLLDQTNWTFWDLILVVHRSSLMSLQNVSKLLPACMALHPFIITAVKTSRLNGMVHFTI
jgi:hypothetical protein